MTVINRKMKKATLCSYKAKYKYYSSYRLRRLASTIEKTKNRNSFVVDDLGIMYLL